MTKRMTKINGIGEVELICCFNCDQCGNDNENCGSCEKSFDAYDKLAAYEDTGLTPERAAELSAGCDRWKARAEALERALIQNVSCETCGHMIVEEDEEPCYSCCNGGQWFNQGGINNWQFDEQCFSEVTQ